MGCAGCAARVNTVLNSLNGVKHASVSFVSGRAYAQELQHGHAGLIEFRHIHLFSLFNLLFPLFWERRGMEPHLYFESSSMVIAFVLAVRLLENKARRNTVPFPHPP